MIGVTATAEEATTIAVLLRPGMATVEDQQAVVGMTIATEEVRRHHTREAEATCRSSNNNVVGLPQT